MAESVLPCPFCGGEPTMESFDPVYTRPSEWVVHCPRCDVSLDGRPSPAEAETLWNRRTVLAALLAAGAAPAMASISPRQYRVSPAGNDRNDGIRNPVQTITAAMRLPLLAGDEVVVAAGDYPRVHIGKGGLPGLPITIRAETPGAARIVGSGTDIPLQIAAPWVNVWGLAVVGHEFSSAVVVDRTHHVTVQRLTVRKAGGSGVYSRLSEWVNVIDCDISECCSNAASSGISIHKPAIASGDKTTGGWRFIIRGNRVHENIMTTSAVAHTDGNGIILDEFGDYPFPALVELNRIWSNGGDAIMVNHSYVAANMIRRNDLWGNGTDQAGTGLYGGEMSNRHSHNTSWVENAAHATQRRSNCVGNVSVEGKVNRGVSWRGNILWADGDGTKLIRVSAGNSVPRKAQGNVTRKPFVNPPRDWRRAA